MWLLRMFFLSHADPSRTFYDYLSQPHLSITFWSFWLHLLEAFTLSVILWIDCFMSISFWCVLREIPNAVLLVFYPLYSWLMESVDCLFMRNPHDENFSHFSLYGVRWILKWGFLLNLSKWGWMFLWLMKRQILIELPMSQDRVQGFLSGHRVMDLLFKLGPFVVFCFSPHQSIIHSSFTTFLPFISQCLLLLFPKRLPLLLLCWGWSCSSWGKGLLMSVNLCLTQCLL